MTSRPAVHPIADEEHVDERRAKPGMPPCHKDARDALHNADVEIDDDVREEHRRDIRNMPENSRIASFRARGKYRGARGRRLDANHKHFLRNRAPATSYILLRALSFGTEPSG